MTRLVCNPKIVAVLTSAMFPLVIAFPSARYTFLVVYHLTTVVEIEWHFDNIAVDAGGEDKEENVSFPLAYNLISFM